MATTKTIQPTGTTITMPAMSDKPDISVISTDLDRITDAVNAENQALLSDAFALKTGTDIPRNTNFNTLITPGNYRVRSYSDSASMTNIPIARVGTLYVKNGMLESGANYIQQIYATFDNNIYIRYSENKGSAWSAWDQLALKSMLTTVTATYTFNNVGVGTGSFEQVQLPVPSGKTLLMASVYQSSGLNLVPVWIKSVGSSSATVMVWNGRTSEATIGVTVVGLCW